MDRAHNNEIQLLQSLANLGQVADCAQKLIRGSANLLFFASTGRPRVDPCPSTPQLRDETTVANGDFRRALLRARARYTF